MSKTPQQVAQEILDFSEKHPDADYSIGHIVLSDFNIDRSYIWSCFSPDNFVRWASNLERTEAAYIRYHLELAEVIKFLQYLMQYDDDLLDQVSDVLLGEHI